MHELDDLLLHWGVKGMKWDEEKRKQKDEEEFQKIVKEKNLSPQEADELRAFMKSLRNPKKLTPGAFRKALAEVESSNKKAMISAKNKGKQIVADAMAYYKKHGKLPNSKIKITTKKSKTKYANEDKIDAFIKSKGLVKVKKAKSDDKYAKIKSETFLVNSEKGKKAFDKALKKKESSMYKDAKKNGNSYIKNGKVILKGKAKKNPS